METFQALLMVLQTFVFVTTWMGIHNYVTRHGPIAKARSIVKFNSWFYAGVSLVMFCLILMPSHEQTASYLYHYSKFYEYIDILGVRASGGLIDLHFGVHHLTTPYFTFIRVINHNQCWMPFAALNTFHHALMYAYFGGVGFLRPFLLVTCGMQYAVGLTVEAWMIHRKQRTDEESWPNVFCFCLLLAYSVLWIRDLRLRSVQQVQESDKKTS